MTAMETRTGDRRAAARNAAERRKIDDPRRPGRRAGGGARLRAAQAAEGLELVPEHGRDVRHGTRDSRDRSGCKSDARGGVGEADARDPAADAQGPVRAAHQGEREHVHVGAGLAGDPRHAAGGRFGHITPSDLKPILVTPAALTAAVIRTDGKRQVIGLSQMFNVGDVRFRLAAVTRKTMRIKAVGAQFAGGKHALTVRKGHGVKLANTATGVTYHLRFEAGTTASPTVIQPSSTTPKAGASAKANQSS